MASSAPAVVVGVGSWVAVVSFGFGGDELDAVSAPFSNLFSNAFFGASVAPPESPAGL